MSKIVIYLIANIMKKFTFRFNFLHLKILIIYLSCFQVVARETLTMEKYVSEPATVRLILADLNDFNPSFESSSYICDINPFDKNFHLNKAVFVFF